MSCQKVLYLSPVNDADLICLLKQIGPRAFAKAVKESLRMSVRAGYQSKFLDNLHPDPTLSEDGKGRSIRISIAFGAEEDSDVRSLLSNARPRKQGILMKQSLRFAIGPYFTLGCFLKGDKGLCKDYTKRQLFFVENTVKISRAERITSKRREVPAAPVYTAPVTEEPVVSPPVISGDGQEFTDDDILSMLEMM